MSGIDSVSPVWIEIARGARTAPSPHNTQPFRLKVLDDDQADVVFIPERGLRAADPGGKYSWVAAGVFVELCRIIAHSLQRELQIESDFPPIYDVGGGTTPRVIARLKLQKCEPIADIDTQLIFKRQTSRLPYESATIPFEIIDELQQEASRLGQTLEVRGDAETVRAAVELGQEALFSDVKVDSIRNELVKWLRFSVREEDRHNDGLSARCLTIPGPFLRLYYSLHQIWALPGIDTLIQKSMRMREGDVGAVAYLRGAFHTEEECFLAGKAMIRLWLILTKHGYYLHPYGSVTSNYAVHQHMIERLQLGDEDGGKNEVWLFVRVGKSTLPPKSHRLPLEEILICG